MKTSASISLRWLSLILVILNIFFNYLTDQLGMPGRPVSEVTYQYNSLFTPAGYAFSIWGLIYLSFLLYAIHALRPSQRNDAFYDRMLAPFMLANILTMVWQYVFRLDKVGGSMIVILLTLATAFVLFNRAKAAINTGKYSNWHTVPFSLFLGWLCVATIANTSVWLKSTGWTGGTLGEPGWTAIMIAIALMTGCLISVTLRDYIIPLVVSWAAIAIWVASRNTSNIVSNAALAAGIISFVWAVCYSIWYYRHYHHLIHRRIDA